MIEIQHINSFM